MNVDQIVSFLRTVPIFHSLGQEQFEPLAQAADVRDFARDEVLVEPDTTEFDLFIFLEGEVQIYIRQAEIDFERPLDHLWPGDYFGAISAISGRQSSVSVRALIPGRAIVLKAHTIDDLLSQSPEFARALCRSLANYVQQNIEKVTTVPFARLESFPNLRHTVDLLPPRVSRFCQALVCAKVDDRVKVGMVNPGDTRTRSYVTDVLRQYHVDFVAVTEDDFNRHAAMLLAADGPTFELETSFEDLAYLNSAGEAVRIGEGEDRTLPRVLTEAIRSGASDIHLEPIDGGGRARLRIDGRMLLLDDTISLTAFKQMTTRLKVMSELDITNTRLPQDGRFVVNADGRRVEFRLSVMPCQGGEKAVMRLVAPNPEWEKLTSLVLSEPVAMFAEEIFSSPSGLVLVTGPTGSGKTTTLYAALNTIAAQNRAINIVTIEDPIEYNLEFATQIQVNLELGLGFPEILRSVLRQDPDVILVGEIRDATSAAIALEAAATGHLVLSSLHTYSAMETLVRLRDLQVKPYLLANALKGVISQKLVPRLCPGYTVEVAPEDPIRERLKGMGVLEPEFNGPLSEGHDTEEGPVGGESGRVGVFELLALNDAMRDLIDRRAPMSDLAGHLDDSSFFSFQRYSRFLLKEGIVAPERIEEILPKRLSANLRSD